jgi:hypothetical protein
LFDRIVRGDKSVFKALCRGLEARAPDRLARYLARHAVDGACSGSSSRASGGAAPRLRAGSPGTHVGEASVPHARKSGTVKTPSEERAHAKRSVNAPVSVASEGTSTGPSEAELEAGFVKAGPSEERADAPKSVSAPVRVASRGDSAGRLEAELEAALRFIEAHNRQGEGITGVSLAAGLRISDTKAGLWIELLRARGLVVDRRIWNRGPKPRWWSVELVGKGA